MAYCEETTLFAQSALALSSHTYDFSKVLPSLQPKMQKNLSFWLHSNEGFQGPYGKVHVTPFWLSFHSEELTYVRPTSKFFFFKNVYAYIIFIKIV